MCWVWKAYGGIGVSPPLSLDSVRESSGRSRQLHLSVFHQLYQFLGSEGGRGEGERERGEGDRGVKKLHRASIIMHVVMSHDARVTSMLGKNYTFRETLSNFLQLTHQKCPAFYTQPLNPIPRLCQVCSGCVGTRRVWANVSSVAPGQPRHAVTRLVSRDHVVTSILW